MTKSLLTKRYLLRLLLPMLSLYYAYPADAGVVRWAQNGASVGTTGAAHKLFPSITGNGSGGAYVAWEDYRTTPTDIYVQKIDVNGTPLFPSDKDVTVNNTAAKRLPSIVKDGAGGAFIVWEDDRNKTTSGTDIYIQRIDANGNLWASDMAVCTASGNQWAPRLALTNDSTGDVIVVWEDHRGSISQIYAQRVDKNGNYKWAANGIAAAPSTGEQVYPAISPDGYDGAVIVWEDQRNISSTGSDIYGQRINSAGTGQWGGGGKAITNANKDQWLPAIATDGQNHFIVTWEDYRNNGSNGSDIYAKGIDYGGSVIFDDKSISSALSDQRAPKAAYSGDGFVIVWEDYRSDPVNADIYAQKIAWNGNISWTINGEAVSTANSSQDAPAIASSDTQGVIAAWEDFRSGTFYDIYALSLPFPGSITINNDAMSTATINVNLTLWASGIGSSVTNMRLSNDNATWSAWEAFSTTRTWTLTPEAGPKKVYVQLKDPSGQLSPSYYDDITLNNISINNGAGYTNSLSVTLTLYSTNAAQMCISNTTTCSSWEGYATTKTWTLPGGDGVKTVYVKFRDASLVESAVSSAAITLDTSPPTITSTTPSNGQSNIGVNTSVTITFSKDIDVSTITAANIYLRQGTAPVASNLIYSSATKTLTLTPTAQLSLNTAYTVYVATGVKDLAGNSISSSSLSFTTAANTTPPTGSITINNGSAYTNVKLVTLTLSASGVGNTVTDMRFSSDGVSWKGWETYGTSKTFALPPGDGIKTIYVQFRDSAGNISQSYSGTITLDTTPPGPQGGVTPLLSLNGSVTTGQTVSYSYSSIVFSWTPYSDTSLKEYRLAIGSQPGRTDIVGWTVIGKDSATYSTGDIQARFGTFGDYFGKTFYGTLKIVDQAGNESSLSASFIYTPGDVSSKAGSADGRVDGFDLGMLGIAFGGTTGGAADLNRDGKVDGNDLIILGTNFGKVKP